MYIGGEGAEGTTHQPGYVRTLGTHQVSWKRVLVFVVWMNRNQKFMNHADNKVGSPSHFDFQGAVFRRLINYPPSAKTHFSFNIISNLGNFCNHRNICDTHFWWPKQQKQLRQLVVFKVKRFCSTTNIHCDFCTVQKSISFSNLC